MIRGRLVAWNRRLDESIDLRALAVLRIALGPIVIIHLLPFLDGAINGVIYSDRFTLPFWSWFPNSPGPATSSHCGRPQRRQCS